MADNYGIQFDSDGFIISNKQVIDRLGSIDGKLNDIYKHLLNDYEKKNKTTLRTVYEHDLNQASKSVKRFAESVNKITDNLGSDNQKPKRQNLIVPHGTPKRIRDYRPANGNTEESKPLSTIRSITPLPTQSSQRENNDVPHGTPKNNGKRERDSKGRFIKSGSGTDVSEKTSFFTALKEAVKSGVASGNSNTENLDPTVDAIKELGTLLSPLKKASELAFKPLTGLAKLKKRNEPVSREQAKVNTEQTSLLRQINRHSANSLSVMGLARMLPMAATALGSAVAVAVGTVLLPELKKLLGLNEPEASTDHPDHTPPDDVINPSLGDLPNPTGNAKNINYSRKWNNHEGEGLQQIIGKPLHPYQPSNGFFTVGNNATGGNDLSVHEKTKGLIRHYERYSQKPYYDVNHLRAGYASDTYTTSDGKIHNVTKDTRVSKEDAERDLERRTKIYTANAKKNVGAEAWDKLSDEAKMVATSMAYNYGSLDKLPTLVKALKSGDKTQIANEIQRRGVDNNGARVQRRNEEANLIRSANGNKYATAQNQKAVNANTTAKPLEIKPLSAVKPDAVKPQALFSPINRNDQATNTLIKNTAKPITVQKPDVTTLASSQNININSSGNLNISQNISDRTLHHAISGGIGLNDSYHA